MTAKYPGYGLVRAAPAAALLCALAAPARAAGRAAAVEIPQITNLGGTGIAPNPTIIGDVPLVSPAPLAPSLVPTAPIPAAPAPTPVPIPMSVVPTTNKIAAAVDGKKNDGAETAAGLNQIFDNSAAKAGKGGFGLDWLWSRHERAYDLKSMAWTLKYEGRPGQALKAANRQAAEAFRAPASAGSFRTNSLVDVQKENDCGIRALWNNPALRPVVQVLGRYERFLLLAEKLTGKPHRVIGSTDDDESAVLRALGFDYRPLRKPKDAEALARMLDENAGSVNMTFDFGGLFGSEHGVALTGARRERSSWLFYVTDSNFSFPQAYSFEQIPPATRYFKIVRRDNEAAGRPWTDDELRLKTAMVWNELAAKPEPGFKGAMKALWGRLTGKTERPDLIFVTRVDSDTKLLSDPPAAPAAEGKRVGSLFDTLRWLLSFSLYESKYRDWRLWHGWRPREALSAVDAQAAAARKAEAAAGIFRTHVLVEEQKYGDCGVRTLWNHPALLPVVQVLGGYERFLTLAEKITKQDIRGNGTFDVGQEKILQALGYRYRKLKTPYDEDELAALLDVNGGALAVSLSFSDPFGKSYHGVVLSGAKREKGHWTFYVTDSNFSVPQAYTFDQLYDAYSPDYYAISRSEDAAGRPLPDVQLREKAAAAWNYHVAASPSERIVLTQAD